MELLTWLPLLTVSVLLVVTFVLPGEHPHPGRHYSRPDRRRFCR
jgi:hypothetical protein